MTTKVGEIKNFALTLAPSEPEALDRWLGELEALVYSARQEISDMWSVARTAHLRRQPSNLGDLA